ncbi:MAG: hypothetical protein CMN28_07365 [Salinisphaeraceae bacterium]|jgi:outer membrane protein|nr:hypothetical protein [Salinisphaeraceae bacterium]
MLTSALAGLAGEASAARAGDVTLSVGWTHIRANETNRAPLNRLRSNALFPVLGVQEEFRSDGVDIKPRDVNTLALVVEYHFTHRWSLQFIGGYPPTAKTDASGPVAPTGPVGAVANINLGEAQFQPAGQARQWSPALVLARYFGRPADRWRSFVGLGVNYSWFTQESLNDNLERAINRRFGAPLALAAGRSGPTQVDSRLEAEWAPVLTVGARLKLASRWSLKGSLAYIPLATTAVVDLAAADGTALGNSRTRIEFDPVVATLLLGYRF